MSSRNHYDFHDHRSRSRSPIDETTHEHKKHSSRDFDSDLKFVQRRHSKPDLVKDWQRGADTFVSDQGNKDSSLSQLKISPDFVQSNPAMSNQRFSPCHYAPINPCFDIALNTKMSQDPFRPDNEGLLTKSNPGYEYGNSKFLTNSQEMANDGRSMNHSGLSRKDHSDSDNSKYKEQQAITFPEYKCYQDQVNQLMDGKMNLEFQLLKLKQDREILKDQGAVHEDTIMKDNANMQRGIKTQIQMTSDNLVRLQTFLASCQLLKDKPVITTKSDLQKNESLHRSKSSERESSAEKEKRKKKKKNRTRSSSENDTDKSLERKRKKKRRKQNRKLSKSGSDPNSDRAQSDSEEDDRSRSREKKKKKNKRRERRRSTSSYESDQDREVKKSVRKPSPSSHEEISKSSNPKSIEQTNDENMMAILSKMSAAYTNVKNENKSLLETIENLKSENTKLRDILSKVDAHISNKAKKEATSAVYEDHKSRTEDPSERSKRLKEEYATVITRIEETVRNGSKNREPVLEQDWSAKNDRQVSQDWSNKNDRQVSLEAKLRNLSNETLTVKAGFQQKYSNNSPKKTEPANFSKESDIYEEYDRNFGSNLSNDKKLASYKAGFLQPVSPDKRRTRSNLSDDEIKAPKSIREWDQGKNQREFDQGKTEKERDRGKLHEPKKWKHSKNDYDNDEDYNSRREKKSCDKYDSRDKHGNESKKEKDYYYDDEDNQLEHKRRKTKSKNKKNKRRSRSSSDERSKTSASHQNKRLDEKSEHICLEEWTPDKPSYKNDPTMESLKLKLKEKEDKEEEKERKKQQREAEEEEERNRKLKESQAAKIPPPPPPPEPPQRTPVAIQWGAAVRSRATPDKSIPTKKTPTAFVGKMPGRGFKKMTPDKETSPAPASVNQPLLVSKPVEALRPEDSQPPTPANIDIKKILEAAQAHIKNRNNKEEIEIPLPPLPAAQDKDPEALKDTRPVVQNANLNPEREKSEMELMIEKHATGSSPANNGFHLQIPIPPGPPPPHQIQLGSYQMYSVGYMPANQYTGWPPSYNSGPPVFQPPPPYDEEETGYVNNEQQFALPPSQHHQQQQQQQQQVENDEELAMLGIDPEDLTGFGN